MSSAAADREKDAAPKTLPEPVLAGVAAVLSVPAPARRCDAMKAILIAEGDDRVAGLFADLFARDGWTVTTCLEGQCAADALGGRAPYEAVLVCNRLPDMGGVELITRIRALGHRNDVPIVMVTGTIDCVIVAGALAAGADDVLYKPVDVDILVDTVNKCVEQARQSDLERAEFASCARPAVVTPLQPTTQECLPGAESNQSP